MAKILNKYDLLNDYYSKEIEKINEILKDNVACFLIDNGPIAIFFNDIFDEPEKHFGAECIAIAELLREQDWDVEINDGQNDIEDTIAEDGWDSDFAGWYIS